MKCMNLNLKKNKFLYFNFFFILFLNLLFAQTSKKTQNKHIENFTLSFELVTKDVVAPVALASPKDGSERIFIVEQIGKIKVFSNGSLREFVDLRKKVTSLNPFYSEKGLLGLAFHPKHKENRKFYIAYSTKPKIPAEDHRMVISEMVTSLANPDKAMLQTERVILEISQPESNHNGGCIEFGPDGYLYIGMGDGGGAGDMHGETGNAQNLENLLGKILRIDIDSDDLPYKIPKDNPFKSEIYAYGLRNPWKFSFDRKTKRLFAADVGQDRYEEVNIIEKGKNYGWKIMEGMHCFSPPENCPTKGLSFPIHEYDHSIGNSVIGGYVYTANPKSFYYGKYIFGDWSGKIFALVEEKGNWKRIDFQLDKGNFNWKFINSFGEDEKGNLYLLTQEDMGPNKPGYVFKIKL